MEQYTGNGYLKVWVTKAGRTLPVKGVPVRIYDRDGQLLYSLQTGDSGLTSTVELRAPAASESRYPVPDSKPYATYVIRVQADGYRPVTDADVRIFEGITAIQPVELVPLSAPEEVIPGVPSRIILSPPIQSVPTENGTSSMPGGEEQIRYRPESDEEDV